MQNIICKLANEDNNLKFLCGKNGGFVFNFMEDFLNWFNLNEYFSYEKNDLSTLQEKNQFMDTVINTNNSSIIIADNVHVTVFFQCNRKWVHYDNIMKNVYILNHKTFKKVVTIGDLFDNLISYCNLNTVASRSNYGTYWRDNLTYGMTIIRRPRNTRPFGYIKTPKKIFGRNLANTFEDFLYSIDTITGDDELKQYMYINMLKTILENNNIMKIFNKKSFTSPNNMKYIQMLIGRINSSRNIGTYTINTSISINDYIKLNKLALTT